MKRAPFLLPLLILASGLTAQIGLPKDSSKTKIAKQDYIILNFNWNGWLNAGDRKSVV